LKLGILSTAHISERSIHDVLEDVGVATLYAVASRDLKTAQRYAQTYKILRWYGTYEELLSDPKVEAVYIPLPNALHGEWTARVLRAKKHVLCEKPLSRSPVEILQLRSLAIKVARHVVEAMHYRYHPDVRRAVSMLQDGCVGDIKDVKVYFVCNLRHDTDIRWSPDLDGGALMDIGCYCIDFIRWVTRDDHPCLLRAKAQWHRSGVDLTTEATFVCADGASAGFYCSLRTDAFEC